MKKIFHCIRTEEKCCSPYGQVGAKKKKKVKKLAFDIYCFQVSSSDQTRVNKSFEKTQSFPGN